MIEHYKPGVKQIISWCLLPVSSIIFASTDAEGTVIGSLTTYLVTISVNFTMFRFLNCINFYDTLLTATGILDFRVSHIIIQVFMLRVLKSKTEYDLNFVT